MSWVSQNHAGMILEGMPITGLDLLTRIKYANVGGGGDGAFSLSLSLSLPLPLPLPLPDELLSESLGK